MLKIGIMGAPLDNPNHGCMALLYSLLHVLDQIEQEAGEDFRYTIFDWKYNAERLKMVSALLHISEEKLQYAPYVMVTDPVRFVYHLPGYLKMKKAIKDCDVVVDLTEGDSFSDIYGDFLYFGRTNVKKLVEKLGKPLVLGPQTYGPYLSQESEQAAVEVLRKAKLVLTRDVQSLALLQKIAEMTPKMTSDLAFFLPVGEWSCPETDKIKVGLNASNLLYGNSEMKDRKFKLSVDYEKYLIGVMEKLVKAGNYEIFLISHVNDDFAVHSMLHDRFPGTHLVPVFQHPMEAKACISHMDVFVGARMHGTIAAFTTGVPCISTAYSSKFMGLFAEYDYSAIVDLLSLTTEEAIEATLSYVEAYSEWKTQVANCEEKRREMAQLSKESLKGAILGA